MNALITIKQRWQDYYEGTEMARLRMPSLITIEMLWMPNSFFLGGSTGPLVAKDKDGAFWRISDGIVQEVRGDSSCIILGCGEPIRCDQPNNTMT